MCKKNTFISKSFRSFTVKDTEKIQKKKKQRATPGGGPPFASRASQLIIVFSQHVPSIHNSIIRPDFKVNHQGPQRRQSGIRCVWVVPKMNPKPNPKRDSQNITNQVRIRIGSYCAYRANDTDNEAVPPVLYANRLD